MNDDFGLVRIPRKSRVGSKGICPSDDPVGHGAVSYYEPVSPAEIKKRVEPEIAPTAGEEKMGKNLFRWVVVAVIVAILLALVYLDTRL